LLGRGITAILAAEKGRGVTGSCSGDLEHREEGEEIDRERKGERRKGERNAKDIFLVAFFKQFNRRGEFRFFCPREIKRGKVTNLRPEV